MRIVAVALLLAGCGRLGFDATAPGAGGIDGSNSSGADGSGGGGGDGSGSSCVEPPATKHVPADGDFYTVVETLAPGDVVEVSGGPYTSPGGAVHQTWTGTETAPIIVRAAPGMRPVLNATAGNNVLDLDGGYFVLRGFDVVSGDIGVRLGNDKHVKLEDLYIHDSIDQGITCNRTGESCDSITIRKVEIANTGTTMTGSGITLGCSDHSCTASNSVVEGNFLHDLAGSSGSGITIWFGDNNAVRDDVFFRTSGPAIAIESSPTGLPDILERNLISDAKDNGIQIEGMVYVRNNIVLGGTNDGVSSRLESGSNPVNVEILNNTIIGAAAACVRGANWAGTSQIVANNAFSCGTANVLAGSPVVAGNVGVVAGDVGTPPDVYPTAGSALINASDVTHESGDDFNGTPRGGQGDSGAYERTGPANPGWIPVEGMKPLPASCP